MEIEELILREDIESNNVDTYSQMALDMTWLFSGQPVSDEEFADIGDALRKMEHQFIAELVGGLFPYSTN